MGQYHYIVNRTRGEFLHPHKFGDGLKLMEFGCSGDGTMTALALLLASDNGRDAKSDSQVIGSWAGDKISIAGDYGDPIDADMANELVAAGFPSPVEDQNLFQYAHENFRDISVDMLRVMKSEAAV